MKNYIKILTIILLTTFFASCENDNDNVVCCDGSSIVDLASETESLSTLVSALQLTGLDDILSASGSFTVLAPTNDAFDNFLSSLGANSITDIPNDILANVLMNHVILGQIPSNSLTNGYTYTQAISNSSQTNMSIYINVDNGVTFNGISSVISSDIIASNGMVHIVDGVIGLPSVVTFALADPNFNLLVQALTRDDLTQDFVALLSTQSEPPTPFTVFAPVDGAFSSLLDELGLSSLNDIDEPTLSAVLAYHVISGSNQFSINLSDGMQFSTYGGEALTYVVSDSGQGTLVDNNERESYIILVDVQADNGIIHAIDTVVLP